MEIRKKWILSFWILFLSGTLIDVLRVLNFESQREGNSFISNSHTMSDIICYLIGYCIVIRLVWGIIMYYFAYKKRGTKFLTFILVTLPFFALGASHKFLKYETPLGIFMFYPLLSLLLFGWFWLACYRLRKENARLKREKNPPLIV